MNNEPALRAALSAANGGGDGDIVVQPGTYVLSDILHVIGDGIRISGASGDARDVVLKGQGMYSGAPVAHVFFVSGDDFTAKGLTLREVANHGLQLDVGADRLRVENCIFQDTYEQMLKAPYDTGRPGVTCDDGVVAGCTFEYTDPSGGPQYYIGGIDVHAGVGWRVEGNLFRNIRSPGPWVSEHAVHFWNNASDTTVTRNTIINCDRGIGFGLGSSPHSGGLIANNFIFHDESEGFADVGIGLESAPDATVIHNTIIFLNIYQNAIEYRFDTTSGGLIAANLTNKAIAARDQATASLAANVTNADPAWFTNHTQSPRLLRPVPGVTDAAPTYPQVMADFYNLPRPAGPAPDIGAHEYRPPPTTCLGLILGDD